MENWRAEKKQQLTGNPHKIQLTLMDIRDQFLMRGQVWERFEFNELLSVFCLLEFSGIHI